MSTPFPKNFDDPLVVKLSEEFSSAWNFQERKHPDWNENYELSRNKVRTNRLTQRQAVNIPLMKETEKTILSRIDDPPEINWREKSGDELKEVIFQEIWNQQFRRGKFEWKDLLDKKNVLRTGLSTKMLNPRDGIVDVEVQDSFDVLYDPLTNPLDIESARFIIRNNIFRSVRDILADPRYLNSAKSKMRLWHSSRAGLIQSNQNKEAMEEKMKRIKAMGLTSDEFKTFAGGDTIVSLKEHFTHLWNEKKKKFERWVIVSADNQFVLLKERLEKLIGADFWPFVMWSEDPETNDIYPDSIDDIVRVPNKVLNAWWSQLVENRTLSNFRMHWYDSTNQAYKAQTYEPGPGRMLPAPGNPRETIMPVEISGLDDSLNAISTLMTIVERATGATAIEKGVGERKTMTLGEVQILVGKALERVTAMTKFYRGAWYELAWKWERMMHNNSINSLDLFKTGRSGKVFKKHVVKSDWKSKAGYEPTVASNSEQEAEQTRTIQKMLFVRSQSPNNRALQRITLNRELEILDLTPDERKEVEEEEKELRTRTEQEQGGAGPTPEEVEENAIAQTINAGISELTQG